VLDVKCTEVLVVKIIDSEVGAAGAKTPPTLNEEGPMPL